MARGHEGGVTILKEVILGLLISHNITYYDESHSM